MEIVTDGTLPFIPEPLNADASPSEIGIAVDIGTTTIAVEVWSISKRKIIATIAERNNQVRYGSDVIKRIFYAIRQPLPGSTQVIESGFSALHYCVVTQLEKMFTKAIYQAQNTLPRGFQPQITTIVVTGNTTMLNFLCGVPVNSLAQAPFKAECHYDLKTTWKEIREGTAFEKHCTLDAPTAENLQIFNASVIPEETKVYIPPCIGAFIGADTVCAMIAAGFPIPGSATNFQDEKSKAPLMMADIGTNSEIVLYVADTAEKKGRILCTATAAGPAFEAANINCGMSAVDGAIDKIQIENGRIIPHTINDAHAKGICGSGVISAVSNLYEHKFIDKTGAIQKSKSKLGDGSACIEITSAVYLCQQDIRNVQLAKSALKTGLEYLLEKSPVIPNLSIAGGFGTKLNMEDAFKIGMIPKLLKEKTSQIGNAALAGASAMIFSPVLRLRAKELAKKSVQINLAAVPEFQTRFIKSIDF